MKLQEFCTYLQKVVEFAKYKHSTAAAAVNGKECLLQTPERGQEAKDRRWKRELVCWDGCGVLQETLS